MVYMMHINRKSEINHPAAKQVSGCVSYKKGHPGNGAAYLLKQTHSSPAKRRLIVLSISLVVKNPIVAKPL